MKNFVLLIFLFLLWAPAARAAELDYSHFKSIPVLDEGRLKPMDSLARLSLKKISGKETIQDTNAIEWLAETIFDPAQSVLRPVFRLENANLRHRFGLMERKNFLYSYTELVQGLKKTADDARILVQKPRSELNEEQKALLEIHDNALFYTGLMRSLSLLLPLNVDLPAKYKSEGKSENSYLALRRLDQSLAKDLQAIIKRKGEDFSRYSEDEKKTALLSFQLQLMVSSAAGNDIFRVVPPQWQEEAEEWHSPWALVEKGEGSPETAKIFSLWQEMSEAYLLKDESRWFEVSAKAKEAALPVGKKLYFEAEILQNMVSPFKLATLLYSLVFGTVCIFLTLGNKFLYRIAFILMAFGAFAHLSGIALRVVLLARPPVGTLYESMLFVSLSVVLIALIWEKIQKNGVGLLIGSIAGALTGLMSFGFVGEGDTMTMLTAVLNTNFWLATHVLCVTMGYGWCLLVALLAHLSLMAKPLKLKIDLPDTALHLLSMFSLLFMAIGTILGGIWADQSWGRFWGWDPKENGALLIVLWLIWLMHGKLGGQLTRVQFLCGLSYLTVIVGLSWVGVNMLGVGLHSYGFADGYFYGLALFIAVETVLIAYLWRKNSQA